MHNTTSLSLSFSLLYIVVCVFAVLCERAATTKFERFFFFFFVFSSCIRDRKNLFFTRRRHRLDDIYIIES